jgi:hypothetical protein
MSESTTLNFQISVGVVGYWHGKKRTASAELNLLMDRIDLNHSVVVRAIDLIRTLKAQIDAAIASGRLHDLQNFSTGLGQQTHALAVSLSARRSIPGNHLI